MRKKIYQFYYYLFHIPTLFKHWYSELLAKKIVQTKVPNEAYISIIIVTYNAIDYVKKCINSLQKTNYKNKEIIVVDNNSNNLVKKYLGDAKKNHLIDKLYFSPTNTFFSKGNNIGATLTSPVSTHLLLLNSDIEILDSKWLDILIANKPEKGIISFGKANIPILRPDGWCFMINKSLFTNFNGLNDATYKMDGSISELTSQVLHAGNEVKSIVNPDKYIVHYGEKSRSFKRKSIKGISNKELIKLFSGYRIQLLRV